MSIETKRDVKEYLQDEIADEIAAEIKVGDARNCALRGHIHYELDCFIDEIGDTEGIAGSLAAAMLNQLNKQKIIEDVEARFEL